MPGDETTEEGVFNREEAGGENEASAEEFKVSDEFPDEDEIEARIKAIGADVRVSPFDPDFLLFALPLAFAVDILDTILEIAGIFVVIPKIVGIVIDLLTLAVLGGWLYWRTGKIAKSKRDYVAKLRETAEKGMKRLSSLQKLGKVSPKVFDRYMRLYSKQMGKVGRVAAKTATKPLARSLIRGGLAFLGEIIPIIGMIPCWTIMVVLALREK